MKSKMKLVPVLAILGLSLAGCAGSAEGNEEETATQIPATIESPQTITNGKLTVCAPLDSPPNNFYNEDHQPQGLEVDLARAVAAKMGLEAEFRETTFASVIPTLQGNQCDVIMAQLYIKPEREEIVDFVPYMMSGQAVAVNQGNPHKITGMDDSLCGLKIGVKLGTTASLYAEDQAMKCAESGREKLDVAVLDNGTVGLQQMTAGQLDAYSDTSPLVLYYQQQANEAYEVAGDTYGEITVGAAVNKGNTQLQEPIDEALAELRQDGTYEEYLENWNLEMLKIN